MFGSKSVLKWSAVAVTVVGVQVCFGQSVTQSVGTQGTVDWSQRKIRATGVAAPNPNMPPGSQRAGALEAAKLTALRNLLQTVKGMAIDSETLVNNAMVESDVIRTSVSGFVQGFTVVDTRYMSDMSVEVEVEIPIAGISDVVLPPGAALQGDLGNPNSGYGLPGGQGAPSVPAGVITGIVINAKGLGVVPAMAPKILDEDGNEVYGSRLVNRDWAVQQGMVGYAKVLNEARANKRVAPNAMVLNALKAAGNNKADVVISNADAQALQQASTSQSFLDKCQVMFVVD
ncbi:MAG: LPP20 family lipoprotein [bacterium]